MKKINLLLIFLCVQLYAFSQLTSRPFITEWVGSLTTNNQITFVDHGSDYEVKFYDKLDSLNTVQFQTLTASNFSIPTNFDTTIVEVQSGIIGDIFADKNGLIHILQWGDHQWNNLDNLFHDSPHLLGFVPNIDVPNLINVTSMQRTFANCPLFNEDLSQWDFSNVLIMDFMFTDASSFNQDVSSWNIFNGISLTSFVAGTNLSYCNGDKLIEMLSENQIGHLNIGEIPRHTSYSSARISDLGVNSIHISSTIYTVPTIELTGNSEICQNVSFDVTVTSDSVLNYVWPDLSQGSSKTVSLINDSSIIVRGEQAGHLGCYIYDTLAVTVKSLPEVLITTVFNAVCEGESVVMTALYATTYEWSDDISNTNPIREVSPAQTTKYFITGTGSNGCKNIDSMTVYIMPTPDLTITADNANICIGRSTDITVSGAETYEWRTGEISETITVNPIQTTWYYVTGTNVDGCESQDSIKISVNALPVVEVGVDRSEICIGDQVTMTGLLADNYTWFDGSNGSELTFVPTQTGYYNVATMDVNNCVGVDSVLVTVNALPQIEIQSDATAICFGDSITLNAVGGINYEWNTNATTSSIRVSPADTMTYTIKGSDQNGCVNRDTLILAVNQLPTIVIDAESVVIYTCDSLATITLEGVGGVSYVWSTGETANSIVVAPTTVSIFELTGTDANGCVNTGSVVITTDECLSVSEETMSMVAYPNPVSDLLTIEITNAPLSDTKVFVLDLTGKVIFEQLMSTAKTEVSMNNQPAGIYLVKVQSGSTQKVFKLIKE